MMTFVHGLGLISGLAAEAIMRVWRFAASLALALLLSGCSQVHDRTERTEFENASTRRLAAAKAGLDSLAEELRLRADTSRVVWRQQLDSLEVERQIAARKLEDLKTAESKRWAEIKNETAGLLSGLEAGTDSLKTRLRR
jgi:PBP1b-binding outer membrane lipoprotein LpoB